MNKSYIPILAFLALLILTTNFTADLASSVVPGWHTTIYTPYYIISLILSIFLLFAVIGYWLLSKRVDKTNWILFAFHITLTIPSIAFLNYPTIFLVVDHTKQEYLLKALSFRLKIIPAMWVLFIVGQALFLIYFIRAYKSKTVTT